MWSGRPEKVEPKLWLHMLQKFGHLLEDIDKHIISFVMCDEVEQYHAFEQLWVDYDRRRTEEFQSEFLQAIEVLAADHIHGGTGVFECYDLMRRQCSRITTNYSTRMLSRTAFEVQFKDMFEPAFGKSATLRL